jgi:hypothetical protein
MVRLLFIVSPNDPATYRSLTTVLAGDRDAEVIYDRREPPLPRERRSLWGNEQLRSLEDRRLRRDIDTEIRDKGWACVRVDAERPVARRRSRFFDA